MIHNWKHWEKEELNDNNFNHTYPNQDDQEAQECPPSVFFQEITSLDEVFVLETQIIIYYYNPCDTSS